jgi:hypothetical protein
MSFGLTLPNLHAGNHHISSPQEHHHNCIAYAVHREWDIIWPDEDGRWPLTVPRMETISAFVEFFRSAGFEEVGLDNTSYEWGYEKIAVYARHDKPMHAARQLTDGCWKSRLGRLVDITHADLASLEGGDYGTVVKVMRRIDTGSPPELPPLYPPAPLIIMP